MRKDLGFFVAALVAAFLLTFAMAAQAKQFPLDRPMTEEGTFVCIEQAKALDLVQTLIASGEQASATLAGSYVRAGLCGQLPRVEITCREQLFREDLNGVPVTVFRAEVRGVTVYVPLVGWTASPGV